MSNTVKAPQTAPESHSPDAKPEIVKMAEMCGHTEGKEAAFIEKSSTEVITIEKEIFVVGLSLQKSGLPISFASLGKLWGDYSEKYRYHVKHALEPIVEYAVCLNKVPDYITGCAVSKIDEIEDGWMSYTIPQGRYIKDTFNAETFHQLTSEIMEKRNVKAWAKKNNIKINGEFTIEVYPIEAVENRNVEMYTLTPVSPQ